MMEGCWEQDLRRSLRDLVNPERLAKWGTVDLSKNLAASLIKQLAVLYSKDPAVSRDGAPPDDPQLAALLDQVQHAGLWQMGTHNQQLTLAQREGSVVVHRYEGADGVERVGYQVVPVDRFFAVGSQDTPDIPHTYYWYRPRLVRIDPNTLRNTWTRDCYSIEDIERPFFRIEDTDGKPITDQVEGVSPAEDDGYLWRFASGQPYIPAVVYHALRTGNMYDYTRGIELFDGSLRVSGLWHLWQHVVRDASWPQRCTMNMQVVGANVKDGTARVVADPAVILNFESRPGVTASQWQWQPGGNPEEIGRSIQAYAADLTAGFDISAADVKRTHGDARSGYAIEITKDGAREAQRKYGPQFARADAELLGKTAALLGLPDQGYQIRYTGVSTTFSERKQMIEEYGQRIENGLASRVQALAALDDISEDDARQRLREIRQDAANFPDPRRL